MLAEGFVLAAWLVWGGGSFLKRLAIHWIAVIVLGLVWLLGAIVTEGVSNGDIRDVLEVIPVSLPLAAWRSSSHCGSPACTSAGGWSIGAPTPSRRGR